MVPWKERLLRFWRDRRGITGLETAIVLIAFVVVSATFAFAVLSTGLFSSDQAKATINAGLQETTGTLELRGPVIIEWNSTDSKVAKVYFQVALSAGKGKVDLTPGKTLIRYTDPDETAILTGTSFTVTGVGNADSDSLLEPGELYLITVDLAAAGLTLGADTTFSLEVMPPKGGTLYIERTVPTSPDTYEDLG